MPKTSPSPVEIVGPLPDTLLGDGRPPRADVTREYLASGGMVFPLVGQLVLAHDVDDLSRDLGIQVYEAMLNDPTVASACNVLWTGILAGEFQIVPAVRPGSEQELTDPSTETTQPTLPMRVQMRQRGGNAADPKNYALALEIAEFCRRQIDRLNRPIKQIMMEFLSGMALGTKLAEKVFEPGTGVDDGKIVIHTIRHKRNAAWSFIIDPFGDVVAVRGLVVGGTLQDMPPAKFMFFSWLPTDSDPRGHSILRPAYNAWNLKINTWAKYYKYLDKFGTPTVVGIAAADAPDEPQLNPTTLPAGPQVAPTTTLPVATGTMLTPTEAMFYMLQRLESGSVAAIRSGSDIKFIQAVGNGEAFKNAFDLYKHEILEGILLSARATTEARYGSKKDSESALDVVARLIEFGRSASETMLEDQLFHQLVELNWGKEVADLYTPSVSFGEVEQQDIAMVAQSYASLGYMTSPSQWSAIDAKLGLPVRNRADLMATIQLMHDLNNAKPGGAGAGQSGGPQQDGNPQADLLNEPESKHFNPRLKMPYGLQP